MLWLDDRLNWRVFYVPLTCFQSPIFSLSSRYLNGLILEKSYCYGYCDVISPFKEIMKKDKHDHFLKNPFFKPSLALEDGVKIGLKTIVCSTASHQKAEKRRTPFFRTLFIAFYCFLESSHWWDLSYQKKLSRLLWWNFGMPDEYLGRHQSFVLYFFGTW